MTGPVGGRELAMMYGIAVAAGTTLGTAAGAGDQVSAERDGSPGPNVARNAVIGGSLVAAGALTGLAQLATKSPAPTWIGVGMVTLGAFTLALAGSAAGVHALSGD